MRRPIVLLVVGAFVAGLFTAAPATAAPKDTAGPTVYVGQLSAEQLETVGEQGLDHGDLVTTGAADDGRTPVEVVLTPQQADRLEAAGVSLEEKEVAGASVSQRLEAEAEDGYSVFRRYSGPGGIAEEMRSLARQYPRITKLVTIGRTVQGQEILAVKVTNNARRVRDGSRPAVLYNSAQHAREWITPEMTRRLLRHYLEQYDGDATIRRVVNRTELWFVPVANADGYDYTFTQGNRLWRKNLRDNDGDGAITGNDGVDLNRNFPYRWGYDNEGSSPAPGSATYRGTGPASEPETQAMDGLLRRIRFAFQVNYHSAAELLLYGVGWQVATPSPDDLVYEALAGDDANPAVPGYDPDISAELYTTNGETTEHAHERYGTLAYTPEMSTCQTASAVDPDDAFQPADCESVFNFPDSEPLVQAEFEKNVPFALSLAQSAPDPDDPVSVVDREAPDFVLDRFEVSYGSPQPVAVTAKRDLRRLTLNYSVNGRRAVRVPAREWRGGERYGDDGNTYYAEYRGTVRGTRPGDQVRVWFTGNRRGEGRQTSGSFTYRVAEDTGREVLVVANEDYEGVNPDYPASVTAPKYAEEYVAALRQAGYRASVWDVSRQGVPHHLGVLSHFDGVVWHLGDNRLTQDPEDELTQFGDQQLRDAAVAERQQYLTIAVRDYLNEGGKLVHTGETAGYLGTLGAAYGGIFYGLDGAPEQDCVVSDTSECLVLSDDFYQYYLGAYSRSSTSTPRSFTGSGDLAGAGGAFGGPAVADNPLNEPGTFTVTSSVLPPEQFPQFASEAAGTYEGAGGGAFDPIQGDWYVGGVHVDDAYLRLARTIDLTGVAAVDTPQLRARLSFDVEPGYDHVIVEAHPVGSDDWTTLPEAGGLTSTEPPAECGAGYLLAPNPSLRRYLTPSGATCTPTGTTGSWNSMTGTSGGWRQATFDLSAYAGQRVEVAISYVTDPAFGGTGVVVDDTEVVVRGEVRESEGFEDGLGAWTLPGPPAGSSSAGDFRRAQALFFGAVSTRDTILLGFGVEQLASRDDRAELLGEALDDLLTSSSRSG